MKFLKLYYNILYKLNSKKLDNVLYELQVRKIISFNKYDKLLLLKKIYQSNVLHYGEIKRLIEDRINEDLKN